MAVQWKFKNTAGGNVPADLVHRIEQLEQELTPIQNNITTLQNNQTSLGQQVQTLEGSAVKTTGDQNKSGRITFTSDGSPIEFKPGNANATFIAGRSGSNNQRIWYFGKGSSSSNDISFVAEQGKLLLSGTTIHCNNKRVELVATPTANNDAANKAYVDAIKTQIKEKVAASNDFADFKTKIANW